MSTGGFETESERKNSIKTYLVAPNFPSNNLASGKGDQTKEPQHDLMPKCRTDDGDTNFQRILYSRPRSSLRQKFMRRVTSKLLKDEHLPRENATKGTNTKTTDIATKQITTKQYA